MLKKVTYSPSYTLVPTYECFNRCTYCNFRVDPGQDFWLTRSQAKALLLSLPSENISEILILSGEVHPHSPQRKAWLQRIDDLCQLTLEMGFLPHTNAGPLSYGEMAQLKQVNVSMGLMLEQIAPKLLDTVHRHAPSKIPQTRLQQLEWAGELKIPFTTGLLLGIGETEADWWETLEAIAAIHHRWGHIQEVILQPHRVGSRQSLTESGFDLVQLPYLVAKAREILPEAIAIQIPPNLISSPEILLDSLAAGATDLGGINPKDEVNPDYPHLPHPTLIDLLEAAGWHLVPRLAVYPQYYEWLSPSLQKVIQIGYSENTPL